MEIIKIILNKYDLCDYYTVMHIFKKYVDIKNKILIQAVVAQNNIYLKIIFEYKE